MKFKIYKILIGMLIFCIPIYSFDWEFYVKEHGLDKLEYNFFGKALNHFIKYGRAKHLKSTRYKFKNTNFDWKYYVKKNNLENIRTEKEAYKHYINIGSKKKLDYCKKFKILITFHLFNLHLMNLYMDKINTFIQNNDLNEYYIIINIPIDENINQFKGNLNLNISEQKEILLNKSNFFPYHPHLIKDCNLEKLSQIIHTIKNKLNVSDRNLKIIFSENRGMDIGGFLIMLDQIKKLKIKFDYLVKLHTKSRHSQWGEILTSFLNIKVNKLLNQYNCIYSCDVRYPDGSSMSDSPILLLDLFKKLDLIEKKKFSYCAGTMFIVSSKFFENIINWNFLYFVKILKSKSCLLGYEHAFERIFGYLFEKLDLKKFILDYYPKNSFQPYEI